MTNRELTATSANEGALPRAAMLKALAIAILTTAVVLLVIAAQAGTYTNGVVKDQGGRPVVGAIVTLTDRQLRRATSFYTASDGSFQMPDMVPGQYDLRVRRAGYADLAQNGIAITGQPRELQFTMSVENNPNELAWQLPANRW